MLSTAPRKYVLVPAGTAANNIVVCEDYHVEVICNVFDLWQGTNNINIDIPEAMSVITWKSSATTFKVAT